MATFLRLVAQLSAKGAKWAWANKSKVMDMILRKLGVQYIIDYIEDRV